MEEKQETKVSLTEGQNVILVYGIVYIILLALVVWGIFAFRNIQIKQANSKIDSIKKQITSQISEDELSQLETSSGQMATLYGKPFATMMLKNIGSSTPKSTVLSSVSFSGGQITIQGTAASYVDVSLFVTALNKQGNSNLQNVEIANASQSGLTGSGGIDFTLQAKLQ